MRLRWKFRRIRQLVGIDIGTATTKIVVLQKYKKEVAILHTIILNNREEDLYTEQEIAERLTTILEDGNFDEEEVILGLPHHYGLTQLVDFPAGSEKKLPELVAYEARQIAGLSGEGFIDDYAPQEPFYHYKLPVNICLCRSILVHNRVKALENAQLNLADLTLEGIALANAFLYVEPEARNRNEVLMVLDIGAVNTTMALVMKGQVFYTASLPFGGDMFTDALAQHLQVSEEEAESVKYNSRILVSDLNSPLTATARAMSSEIQSALEQWKMQAQAEDDPDLKVAEIYLCGGGSLLSGIDEFFQTVYEAQVRRLTVTYQQELQEAMLYPIAYGLALQGFNTGEAKCPISVVPREIKLNAKRRRNYPHLIACSWILTFILAISLAITYRSLTLKEVAVLDRAKDLAGCEKHVPDLKAMDGDINYFNHMLIPFVIRADRNQTFVNTIKLLGEHQHEKDWFLLVADEHSYRHDVTTPEVHEPAPPPTAAIPFFGVGPNAKYIIAPTTHIRTDSMKPWRTLIGVGYTNGGRYQPMQFVRNMIDSLNLESSIFHDVDVLPPIRQMHPEMLLPWRKYQLRHYAIEMPLKELDFDPEVLN
jgi:type IV pilus assembly protein PilM